MGRLTTHVLDTRSGKPAAGMRVELSAIDGDARRAIKAATTNADGRLDAALLEGRSFDAGVYELEFFAGDYFRAQGVKLAEPAFLDRIRIRFGVDDATAHYHVPLLVTPWSYSTYRGS